MSIVTSDKFVSIPDIDPVVDFHQLLQRCMGDRVFAERCLTRFQQEVEADVEQLQQSLKAGDSAEAARIAHLIKGSAATIAATAIAETAGRLESAVHQFAADDTELVHAARALVNEVDRFAGAIPMFHKIG